MFLKRYVTLRVILYFYICFMSATPSENPIIPSEVIPPVVPPNIDYRTKLRELGIEESQITPELLQRFQEALRRYQSWTDANLALLEERVLGNLDKASATIEEKIDALTTWIETQEATLPQVEPTASGLIDAAEAATVEVTETLEEMRTRLQTEATNQAKTALEAKLSNFPFFWEALAWWLTEQGTAYVQASTENGIWGKIKTFFIGLIAGMFWVQGIFEELKARVETARNAELPVVPTVLPVPDTPATPEDSWESDEDVEWENTVEDRPNVDVIDEAISWNTRNLYYLSWVRIIVSLNGHRENTNASTTDIFAGLKDMTFNEILTLNESQKRSILGESIEDGEEALLDEILNSFRSETTETLLSIALSKETIRNTLSPNGEINAWLAPLFWDDEVSWIAQMNRILDISVGPSFDWKNLTFEEIATLYLSSLSLLRSHSFSALWATFSDTSEFFWEAIWEWFPEGTYIIPPHILEAFTLGMGTDITTTAHTSKSSDEIFNLLLWTGKIDESDKETIQSIVEMKEYLKGDFLESPKLMLSEEQKELFKRNLDYAWVLGIYSILWWNADISILNPLSLPALIYAISVIIGLWNNTESYQWTLYLGWYIRKSLLEWRENWLSDDEISIFHIYGKKVLDVVFLSHMDNILRLMGISSGIAGLDLQNLWLASLAWGITARLIWGRLIASGLQRQTISLAGTTLKRLGLIWVIAGIWLWGAGLILWENENHAFAEDVEEAMNNGDIERFLEILKIHQESIQEFTTPSGEKIVVSAYPWEVPFFVYNEKIYIARIADASIIDSIWSTIWNIFTQWDFSWLLDIWARIIWLEWTWNIDGVNFEIQRYVNGNIVFGEEWNNQYTLPLDTVLSLGWWEEQIVWNDFVHSISNWEYTIPYLGSEWVPGYILGRLWDSHLIFLHEVWELGAA